MKEGQGHHNKGNSEILDERNIRLGVGWELEREGMKENEDGRAMDTVPRALVATNHNILNQLLLL